MESSNLTATLLIERARRGDRAAQDALWRAHRRWVAAIVLAHRPRAIDVEDLMQDVALKMVDKIETLRETSAFKPWLRRIIINTCRGAARSLKPTLGLAQEHDGHDSSLAAPRSHEEDSADWVETKEYADRVLEHVLGLPAEYREPLILRCVRSLSYNEISEILDLPLTTVETRLARARKMLREEMGEGERESTDKQVERSTRRGSERSTPCGNNND